VFQLVQTDQVETRLYDDRHYLPPTRDSNSLSFIAWC